MQGCEDNLCCISLLGYGPEKYKENNQTLASRYFIVNLDVVKSGAFGLILAKVRPHFIPEVMGAPFQ
jgi:hypothetical protein